MSSILSSSTSTSPLMAAKFASRSASTPISAAGTGTLSASHHTNGSAISMQLDATGHVTMSESGKHGSHHSAAVDLFS